MLKKIFSLIALVLFPSAALAASAISNVGGTVVNEGETSVEFRFGFTDDKPGNSNHRRFRLRQHIDHGFTDWYALRVMTMQDKREDDNLEHQAFRIENRFQLIERREYGWDGGIRLNYTHSDGDKTPHEGEMRLTAQVPFADIWEFRHNTVLGHDVGENAEHGLTFELRNQLTRKIDYTSPMVSSLTAGVEMFNDFGRLSELSGYSHQDHQIGPLLKGSLENGLFFQLGYRAGISDAAADHSFKLSMGRTF